MSVSTKPGEFVSPSGVCGVAILLQNKTNRSKYMTIGALCGSWRCPTCGIFLRRKWIEHLSGKLASLSQVFILVLPDTSRWDTFHMRFRRAGGSYAIVRQDTGELVVFSDIAVGGESIPLSSVLAKLDKAVQDAADRRPIHTSRNWSLPKVVARLGSWERVSRLSVDIGSAERIVKASGLATSSFFTAYQVGFVVELPSSWEGGEERLLRLLASRSRVLGGKTICHDG